MSDRSRNSLPGADGRSVIEIGGDIPSEIASPLASAIVALSAERGIIADLDLGHDLTEPTDVLDCMEAAVTDGRPMTLGGGGAWRDFGPVQEMLEEGGVAYVASFRSEGGIGWIAVFDGADGAWFGARADSEEIMVTESALRAILESVDPASGMASLLALADLSRSGPGALVPVSVPVAAAQPDDEAEADLIE